MKQYLDLMRHVMENGAVKGDRTGTGTKSVFGHQMRFDLGAGFPLVTTKKLHLKSIIHELLWFLKGDTNTGYLNENGVSIWDDWADESGDLGPVYGAQWRSWPSAGGGHIDQISRLVEEIKINPNSRRLIVSAWNVAELDRMALPPCHCLFQFYVADGRLSCQLYQRSADIFLGVPFNIASYALLTMMVAQVSNLQPGEFIHTFGDAHLYANHMEQAAEQLSREPRHLPEMLINPEVKDLFGFSYEDFVLDNYRPLRAYFSPRCGLDQRVRLALIVAAAQNGVIGRDNALPWRLPGDLKRFKEITMGKPLIMGRKTFDSIGRPLPGRTNIVLSRDPALCNDSVEIAGDFSSAKALAMDAARLASVTEIMVIGGAGIYELALPHADRIYLTEIHANVPGDAVFPAYNKADWVEQSRAYQKAAPGKSSDYSFVILDRKPVTV